ncbi:MAG: hypothetical protein LWW76_02595 [Burkholderiales bacterium]|nr:hypothetical protein [Burkholderiales bacterium]
MHFIKHVYSIATTTDWYLPKTGLLAVTGGLWAGITANEAHIRVFGLLVTITVGLTVILINVPKAIQAWKDWIFPSKNEGKCDE